MKEPKFPRLEDLPKDNKYNFFAEGVFPDSVEEKKDRNKSAQKKKRLPFSLPVEETRPANTQKEDDLVPFFAKNYPPSSESKEDICFINSPPPSDTPDNNGEAEEVDVDEEESEENKNKKNYNKMDNDDIGVSMDFNSEMENEYENPSKLTSREEVQERIRKNQERKKEEQRKKEEEEKRRKELEEKNRKEEEKKRKEKEEKERLKKIEEEKKKKIKSNKKDPLNMLSSIKKNSEDTSNIASNSMINDVQNFFAIPEEKGENESEEDTTKKNFKKSSKEKSIINELSEKKIPSKAKKEDKEKNKSKKNPKSIINDNKETKEININKESKKNKILRKSNGINEEKEKEKKKYEEEEKEESYSNYGDQLADTEPIEIESQPKKEKVKSKKGKKRQKRTTVKKVDQDNKISQVEIYKIYTDPKNIQIIDYDVTTDESEDTEEKTFGDTRQYSLRNRIPTLRHDLNERVQYIYDKKGLPNAKRVFVAKRTTLDDIFRKTLEKNELKKQKKKKRLRKGLNNNDTIKEESGEYNSELLDSENISEYGEDEARILKIPKGGKKSLAKNYDTLLIIKVIEANGKNMIKVDNKEYKDLKSDNEVKVNKNQNFEILNFSDDYLVVQLVFDENH